MGDQVIKLQLINASSEQNNSEIIIVQQNAGTGTEPVVAWTVIRNLGLGSSHPFEFSPYDVLVRAIDSDGNYTPELKADSGDAFQLVLTSSGNTLQPYPNGAASPQDIDIRNDLAQGAMTANVYRDGRLVSQKTGIAPGQKAGFAFRPEISIGVSQQHVAEGEIINPATLGFTTHISLEGLSSADIVMTGGSADLHFDLQNVKYT